MDTPQLSRRGAIKLFGAASLLPVGTLVSQAAAPATNLDPQAAPRRVGFPKPTSIYVSWASHDELSDNVPLTEKLALEELDAMKRLQQGGVHFDYYLLDMFWFEKTGGFREFRREFWPNGPDRWLEGCRQAGVKPGLWLSTNMAGWWGDPWMEVRPEWEASKTDRVGLMSLTEGGFLAYHIGSMQQWYDRGVRLFKFDFADFSAATPAQEKAYSKAEILHRNQQAWYEALLAFRAKNPEVKLMAYNGYGGDSGDTYPVFRRTVDSRWLDVFDSLYCGDPRPADVPCQNFWRSKDIFSDHHVVQYVFNRIPFSRIDNTAFMIGKTGTCYYRGKSAWKGMLVLSAARGGWANTYYGNLELLDERDAAWFARVQKLFYPLQATATFDHFGATPGAGAPYGFIADNAEGAVLALVNPSQTVATMNLPWAYAGVPTRVLFADAGYRPVANKGLVTLGPEQLVLVGTGAFATEEWDLGVQEDVLIPAAIEPLPVLQVVKSGQAGELVVRGQISAPATGAVRLIGRQQLENGRPVRITGGAPPDGALMDAALQLTARQGGRKLTITADYNKQIWSGLSWVCGELRDGAFDRAQPIDVEYRVIDKDKRPAQVSLEAYRVAYSP